MNHTLHLPDARLVHTLGTVALMIGLFGILFAWFPLLGLIALPLATIGAVIAGSAVGLGWERHVPTGLALLGLVVSLTAIAVALSAANALHQVDVERNAPTTTQVGAPAHPAD
jgi:hypothetical protein